MKPVDSMPSFPLFPLLICPIAAGLTVWVVRALCHRRGQQPLPPSFHRLFLAHARLETREKVWRSWCHRLGGDQATREWVQRVAALPVKEAIETLFTALCDTQRPHVVIEANAMTLCGVVLKSLPLNDTVFRGSDMRHCVLDGAQLMRADLREVDAAGASFCKAQMSKCDGRGGIFDRAIFDEACMIRTVFDGASLQDARFDGVVMQQASFHYAELTDSFYHRRITPPVHYSESSGAVGARYAPRHRMIQGVGQPTPAMPMGPRDGFQRPLIRYGPCPPTPPPTRQASPLETISE